MTGGVLGGGVIFVVAALLWGAVLVPAWIRRREFRAAERNAVRLQRTLRVLAETAEVPTEVRVEATAREALAHEKLLRTAQKRQEAERDAALAEARAEQVKAEIRAQQMKRKQVATARAARLRKPIARRLRALSALTALLGLIGLFIGIGTAIAGLGGVVLLWSALGLAIGVGALALLAPGRVKVAEIPAETIAEQAPPRSEPARAEYAEEEAVPESAAEHAAAQRAARARIERAQALARARQARPAPRVNQGDSMLLAEARAQAAAARSAEVAAEVSADRDLPAETPRPAVPSAAKRSVDPRRSEQLAAAARLRQMGVVGDTSEGMPDLDAVLRRRRTAG